MSDDLPVKEDLDFSYLLGLMRPLHNLDEYAWLPELFALIGHEKLIDLCRYAGGETLKIPTLDELSDSIEALQIFYNVYIRKDGSKIPPSCEGLVSKIRDVYEC